MRTHLLNHSILSLTALLGIALAGCLLSSTETEDVHAGCGSINMSKPPVSDQAGRLRIEGDFNRDARIHLLSNAHNLTVTGRGSDEPAAGTEKTVRYLSDLPPGTYSDAKWMIFCPAQPSGRPIDGPNNFTVQ